MDADDLYGLPLDRFVPERTTLARELRSSGRRDEAAEVAALRKPSVAAWAVNQLVRTQRRAIDELFEAGDALRAAHDQVLAGEGDAGSLRSAVARERAAVETLNESARGLLSSDGHELSPTIVERVGETLHAAALDDDARAQVSDGRLERELRHVGLGMVPGALAPAPARAPRRTPSKPARTGAKSATKPAKETKTEDAVRAAAEKRDKARAAARTAEREARRRLERAARATKLATERREQAAEALEAAQSALEEAERDRATAEAQLNDAERALRDLA